MNLESNIEHWISTPVPQCMKFRLNFFHIRYFSGNEMEVLGIFLKNAGVLKTMRIKCCENLNKDEVINQLCEFPRVSTNCKIHVKWEWSCLPLVKFFFKSRWSLWSSWFSCAGPFCSGLKLFWFIWYWICSILLFEIAHVFSLCFLL